MRPILATGILVFLGGACMAPMILADTGGIEAEVPGFQQILPRGKIAALVDPVFVPAATAKLPDEAWILGFEHEGHAFAYDLNLLNSHEIVNHRAGSLPVAAVW